jgi:putative ABC transport system permease protein
MKRWFDPFITAWSGVVTHKLRSSLTILGIVIGVAAVISLMSVGKGAEADILNRIGSLGSDLITIRPGASFGLGGVTIVRGGAGSATTLTQEDAEAVSSLPDIVAAAPTYSRSLQLIAGANNMNATVMGVTPDYKLVDNLGLSGGNFFSDFQYQSNEPVVVLGANVKDTLYPDSDPVGQQLRLSNIAVNVIGVLSSKGEALDSPDNSVYIPLTVMQELLAQPRTAQGGHIVSSISVKISDSKLATPITDEVTSLLRNRHQLSATTDNDFSVTSMEEIAATITATTSTLTLLLGAIAAISLLVGGIGVMNIMLVSVLERTREIGIRKALGAQQRDIWLQFLVEAAFVSLAGGVIGVAVGWVASFLISHIGQMTTLVSPDIVVLAVLVSVGIGLFFGFYPAWNAARLDPIEALRAE